MIRKEIRQPKISSVRHQISTYLVHINKDFLPIDTGFYTASVKAFHQEKIMNNLGYIIFFYIKLIFCSKRRSKVER